MLRTPLFLAMNSTMKSEDPRRSSAVYRIIRAIVSSKQVDLSKWLEEEDEQGIVVRLIQELGNGVIVAALVRAGLSYLPWEACTWADDGHVYIAGKTTRPVTRVPPSIIAYDLVLEVVCNGRYMFLDIAKRNIDLAVNIIVLWGEIAPGSINFSGMSKLPRLLAPMDNKASAAEIRSAIRLDLEILIFD